MFISLPFSCFVAVFVGTFIVEASQELTNYITRLDKKIKPNLVVEQHVLRSKLECAIACASKTFCTGVSWGTAENTCLLSDRNCVDNGVNNWNLQTVENWVTMAEPLYPAAVYEGPSGRYTLSFTQAQSFCAQLNTVIASPDDLLLARSMGYASCTCGWLSDGTNGFILQTPDWGCWGSYNTEIIFCNYNTANVYCHPV